MSDRQPPAHSSSWFHAMASGVILTLFLMRFLTVAESAGQGETLWIVALWMVALFAYAIESWRFPTERAPFDGLSLSVGLLAGGHILSAFFILTTTGDKRSAINLAWEWIGVAVGWWLLRQRCQNSAFRQELIAGLLATGTAVGALGIYQHYIEFPQLAAKYGPLFDQLKTANPTEAARLRQALAKEHIPAEGPGVTLFEKRLRDSREPLGPFALANTLGGFLCVCLILAVSFLPSNQSASQRKIRAWLLWLAITALIGWCLLLTKSRTAWIGTATGLVIWFVLMGYVQFTRKRVAAVAATLASLFLVGWGLVRVGGLDQQVLTEAPKSLQYRLQYWAATWHMIRDHIGFGVGPGQFRSYYLFYKLPEASEEISDPHNLFLDVAANGGLIAFCGLLGLCSSLLRNWKQDANRSRSAVSVSTERHMPLIVTGIAAIGWFRLLVNGADDRLLVLLPVAVSLYWYLRGGGNFATKDSQAVPVAGLSAGFALLVHLCGAGGIGMPAVSLLLLVLASLAKQDRRTLMPVLRHRLIDRLRGTGSASVLHNSQEIKSTGRASGTRISSVDDLQAKPTNSVGFSGLLAGVSLALIFSLYFTGLRPVWAVTEELEEGDSLVQRGLSEAADAKYVAAAMADPFDAEPWRRRAELAYRKSEAERFQSNENFLNAVRLHDESRTRDPNNPHGQRRLGDWWMARWRVTNQRSDAETAVAAYEQAWHRYPTNSLLMSDLAVALATVGLETRAANVAAHAIEQDRINHERGHVDRYLPDKAFAELKQLVNKGGR